MTINNSLLAYINHLRKILAFNSNGRFKIKLAHNKPLSNKEYELTCKICDIFTAISESNQQETVIPPNGGIFWAHAKKGTGPFELHLRKNRKEIDHSFLLNTRFRDFPTIAYEFDKHTPKPDFWVEKYQDLSHCVSKKWRIRMPARFGEIGWNVSGYPVNRLTGINQERIIATQLFGITDYLEQTSAPKILEIGAGGGEMGYILCKALPKCSWFDCDLLYSLVYSAIHLAILLPKKKHYIYVGDMELPKGLDEILMIRNPKIAAELPNAVINIPNFLLHDFVGYLKLHYAYNTYSFGEMPKEAVLHYTNLLAEFLKDYGVLFDQNGYFSECREDNPENILASKFKQLALPTKIDGRWFHSGAIRAWCNNNIEPKLHSITNTEEFNTRIDKLSEALQKNTAANNNNLPHNAWEELCKVLPQDIQI